MLFYFYFCNLDQIDWLMYIKYWAILCLCL